MKQGGARINHCILALVGSHHYGWSASIPPTHQLSSRGENCKTCSVRDLIRGFIFRQGDESQQFCHWGYWEGHRGAGTFPQAYLKAASHTQYMLTFKPSMPWIWVEVRPHLANINSSHEITLQKVANQGTGWGLETVHPHSCCLPSSSPGASCSISHESLKHTNVDSFIGRLHRPCRVLPLKQTNRRLT